MYVCMLCMYVCMYVCHVCMCVFILFSHFVLKLLNQNAAFHMTMAIMPTAPADQLIRPPAPLTVILTVVPPPVMP